ncbi:MAG: hypothetical protein EPO23_10150 [Xanthobacteraceae bacterium]|nr:MAG: hypothetical protein EPO23_10150 [Xanthobacteraceae bacterium]
MPHHKASKRAPARSQGGQHHDRNRRHLEELLNEGLVETFPASDPVAVTQPVSEQPSKTMTTRRQRSGRTR